MVQNNGFAPTLHRTTRAIDRLETPRFEHFVQQVVYVAIRDLLSERGLYQAVSCGLDELVEKKIVAPNPKPGERIGGGHSMCLSMAIEEAKRRPWYPNMEEAHQLQIAGEILGPRAFDILQQPIQFRTPNFRSQCKYCKTSAFSIRSFHSEGSPYPEHAEHGLKQIWHFNCRCETCRHFTNVISVRRVGLRLTVVGRSERIQPPLHRLIPEPLSNIVGDAISAANENDVFGGIYHLRTFVEHYMKAETSTPIEDKMDGDTLCAKYADTLDSRMKLGMPSLAPVYSDLSARLHARRGERTNFDAALETVHRHLEAKEMLARHPHNSPSPAPTAE